MSLTSSYPEKCFETEVVDKIKHTFYIQYLFSENSAIYEIMWQNTAELDRPQMTIWHVHIACWIPMAAINTHQECNTFCFATAAMVARTCLNNMLYTIACLVFTL